jgi:serine/threonine protein kinase
MSVIGGGGRYRIERALAPLDGVARFLARDLSLDRLVELLVLEPALHPHRQLDAFLADARRLARINNPNVVAVHDAVVADGTAQLAREYLPGETLASRLRNGPLPPAEAIRLGRDLLRGLEASHSGGVAHPDLAAGTIV